MRAAVYKKMKKEVRIMKKNTAGTNGFSLVKWAALFTVVFALSLPVTAKDS